MTSSGPAGAVVEATRIAHGLDRKQMLQAAGDGILIFRAGQDEICVDAEALEALAHDVLEQLAGALAADGVGVENSYSRGADRAGLQDGAALLEDADHGVELIFGDGEGGALDGGDALAGDGVAEVQGGGDHHAGGAVDLLEQFVVHQHAAVFGGQEVGPAAGREADFETAAAHLAGDRADRIVLADLAFFQFGYPDGFHAFGLQHANVFVADDMALGQQFLPAGPENGATKDPTS